MKIPRLSILFFLLLFSGIQGFCAGNNLISSSLAPGDLVRLQGSEFRPFDPTQLARIRYFAIYYSASWCPPCRAFTPKLVKFYDEIRQKNPHFELIFVCRDESRADMEKYMKKDDMKWPTLVFSKVRSHQLLNRYEGRGIPDLVLVDANGGVLSDSYVAGQYRGPSAVIEDIKSILEKNPPTAEELAVAKNGGRPIPSATPQPPQLSPPVQLLTEAEFNQSVLNSQKKAVSTYPDLAITGSALHTEFIARLARYKADKREFFTDPDWPMRLAKEIVADKFADSR